MCSSCLLCCWPSIGATSLRAWSTSPPCALLCCTTRVMRTCPPICVLRPNVLQYCDFLTAVVSLWVTLLCLAEVSMPLRTLVSTFGTLCIAIAVENDRTGFLVIALPAGLGLTLVFGSWVRQCVTRRSCFPQPRFWLISLAPGAALVRGTRWLASRSSWSCPPKRRCQCEHYGWPPCKSSNPLPVANIHAAHRLANETRWWSKGSQAFP
ncbi:hypothetical protein MTO96_047905 [Rhipicephalus appendiculatus]